MKYKTKHNKVKKFKSGAIRGDTTNKGRFDLISPFALKRLADVYQRGGLQKGDRNWESGFEISRCLDSAIRHAYQYLMGQRDEDHLAQSAWNLFAAMHFEEMIDKKILPKQLDDLPRYK